METHSVKLLVHGFYADVNARGGLERCSNEVSKVLVTFIHYKLQHS